MDCWSRALPTLLQAVAAVLCRVLGVDDRGLVRATAILGLGDWRGGFGVGHTHLADAHDVVYGTCERQVHPKGAGWCACGPPPRATNDRRQRRLRCGTWGHALALERIECPSGGGVSTGCPLRRKSSVFGVQVQLSRRRHDRILPLALLSFLHGRSVRRVPICHKLTLGYRSKHRDGHAR